MEESNPEKQRFLHYSDRSSFDSEDVENNRLGKKETRLGKLRSWCWSSSALFHFTIFIMYTALAIFAIRRQGIIHHHVIDKRLIPGAMGNEAIHIETRQVFDNRSSVWTGPPSDELDLAWHNLMEGTAIRMSEEEMKSLGQTSVGFRSGGYLAAPAVYHELHCLKQFKQLLYKDHYFPDLVGEKYKRVLNHMNHCHEILRQATLCRGDLSLYFFMWTDPDAYKPLTLPDSQHKCAKWEPIEKWTMARAVGAHPDLKQYGEA